MCLYLMWAPWCGDGGGNLCSVPSRLMICSLDSLTTGGHFSSSFAQGTKVISRISAKSKTILCEYHPFPRIANKVLWFFRSNQWKPKCMITNDQIRQKSSSDLLDTWRTSSHKGRWGAVRFLCLRTQSLQITFHICFTFFKSSHIPFQICLTF